MTHTTQQLQGMSDDELFDALGEKFNSYIRRSALHEDIMPLAFERGVKLDCVACPAGSGFVYYAKSYDGELQSDYDSACRAIACLLLMMEG